jgi:hypothetical protein
MADEQRKLTLITEVDEKRIQRARQRVQELAKAYKSLDLGVSAADEALARHEGAQYRGIAVTDKLGRTVKDAARIEQERAATLREQTTELNQLEKAQKSANAEVKKAVSLNKQIRTSSQELIQAKFAASRLGSAVSGLGLPGVGGAISGTGDIAALAGQLPRLVTAAQGAPAAIAKTTSALLGVEVSFGAVAAAAGPIVIAFAAVSLAYTKFNEQLKQAKKALESAIEAQQLYYETIQAGTRQSIEQALEDATARQQVLEAQIQAQTEAYNQLTHAQRLLTGGALRQSTIDLQNELTATTFEIDALTNSLDSAQVAANNAAAAAQEAYKAQVQQIELVANAEQERLNLIAEGTSQQYEDRIQQIERERATIQRQLDDLAQVNKQNEVYAERVDELQQELADLNREQDILADGTLALIRAREREAEAIEKAKQVREALADYSEDIADIEAKLADTRSESLRKLDQQLAEAERGIEVNLGRANEKAARQLEDQIAKLTREQGDKETDIRAESADRIVELEQKAARDRERILKDYNRSASKAIRDRDAAALTAAQEARDDQLDQTQDQLDESKAKEKKALEDKLKEEERSYRVRLRELQIAHNNELRENRIAAQQRLDDLRREAEIRRAETIRALDIQLQAELQKRNEAFAKQLQQLGAHNINMNNLTAEGLKAIARQFQAFYNSVAGAGVKLGGSQDTVVFPGGKTLGHFQTGGIIPQTGLYMMHKGEPVLPSVDALRGLLADQARDRGIASGGGGMQVSIAPGAFTINSRATSSQGLMRDLERQMPQMLIKIFKDMAA